MKQKHPINPYKQENKVPKLPSNPTMQQEVIHRLLCIFAHATPTSQHKALLFQIVASEDPTPSHRPHEKGNPRRSLHPLNTLPRKAYLKRSMQHKIGRSRIKDTLPRRTPPSILFLKGENVPFGL